MKATQLAFCALCLLVAACGGSVAGDVPEAELKLEMNEALAVAHLRSLVNAQTHAQSLGIVDADNDGVGEYLFLGELAGTDKPRASGAGTKMPLLHPESCRVSSTGFLESNGYLFRVFLPGVNGVDVGEGPGGGGEVEADGAEEDWVAYAWPMQHGTTGVRTFVVTADGTIYGKDVTRNSGAGSPKADSAFELAGDGGRAVADGWQAVD